MCRALHFQHFGCEFYTCEGFEPILSGNYQPQRVLLVVDTISTIFAGDFAVNLSDLAFAHAQDFDFWTGCPEFLRCEN